MDDDEAEKNWSEKVEDLLDSGNTDSAISFLETLIAKFETLISPDSQSQLASALLELAKLYSSKGFSLKSDDVLSRAAAINNRSIHSLSPTPRQSSDKISAAEESRASCSGNLPAGGDRRDETGNEGNSETCTKSPNGNVDPRESSDDDWEAIADRAPEELLSPQCLPEVSKLSLSNAEVKVPKRRGRGTFTYRKQGLCSDEKSEESIAYDSLNEVHDKPEKISESTNTMYGTLHVLVLDGFHPSTTTTDLERLFEDFRDRGFAIRWVNDTLALAVFRVPSVAREAQNSVHCSFSVRILEEDDPIMSSISVKELDPPRQRPKTSARTAQRLIAQELGVKLPSTFGSRELRKQEDARRNRIVTRQNLRDDAWGPEDLNLAYSIMLYHDS